MLHFVMVVDDHKDTRELLVRYLSRMGIPAVACDGARSALSAMRAQPPDIAILDESMPEVTDMELFEQMRSDPALARIPVIFYSANYDTGMVTRALKAGAVAWVVKGVHSLDRLVEAIERAKSKSKMN